MAFMGVAHIFLLLGNIVDIKAPAALNSCMDTIDYEFNE